MTWKMEDVEHNVNTGTPLTINAKLFLQLLGQVLVPIWGGRRTTVQRPWRSRLRGAYGVIRQDLSSAAAVPFILLENYMSRRHFREINRLVEGMGKIISYKQPEIYNLSFSHEKTQPGKKRCH